MPPALPLASPAVAPTMRAAGARRGGGTETTQKPHLPLTSSGPAGLRHNPPAKPGWRFRLDTAMEVGRQQAARLPLAEGWEAAPATSLLASPRTWRGGGSAGRERAAPSGRPSTQGHDCTAARPRGPEEAGGRSPPPRPVLRPRTALPPGPGARPAAGLGARSRPWPGPARPRLPGALQSAHTSARGPFRDILSGDAAAALWASVGGAGGGPGRRRRRWRRRPLAARPGSGKAPARLRAPGQPSAPGAGPEPAVPARPARPRAPSAPRAPRRPAAARRALSPPPPAGSGADPAPRRRGRPRPPTRREEAGSAAGGGRGRLKGPRRRGARTGGVACSPGTLRCRARRAPRRHHLRSPKPSGKRELESPRGCALGGHPCTPRWGDLGV